MMPERSNHIDDFMRMINRPDPVVRTEYCVSVIVDKRIVYESGISRVTDLPFKQIVRKTYQFDKAEDTAKALVKVADVVPDLLAALRAVVDWREGPEGPEVLFKQGTKMIQDVRAAFACVDE